VGRRGHVSNCRHSAGAQPGRLFIRWAFGRSFTECPSYQYSVSLCSFADQWTRVSSKGGVSRRHIWGVHIIWFQYPAQSICFSLLDETTPTRRRTVFYWALGHQSIHSRSQMSVHTSLNGKRSYSLVASGEQDNNYRHVTFAPGQCINFILQLHWFNVFTTTSQDYSRGSHLHWWSRTGRKGIPSL